MSQLLALEPAYLEDSLPMLCMVIGMILYKQYPNKMKVMKLLVGLQLWQGGAKRVVSHFHGVIVVDHTCFYCLVS